MGWGLDRRGLEDDSAEGISNPIVTTTLAHEVVRFEYVVLRRTDAGPSRALLVSRARDSTVANGSWVVAQSLHRCRANRREKLINI